MRLILTARGRTVIDLELLPARRTEPDEEGPTLQANGGGQVERAEPYGDPATQHGFGFHA